MTLMFSFVFRSFIGYSYFGVEVNIQFQFLELEKFGKLNGLFGVGCTTFNTTTSIVGTTRSIGLHIKKKNKFIRKIRY